MSKTAPPEIFNKAAYMEAPLLGITNRLTLPFRSSLSEGVMKRRCRQASRAFRNAGVAARQACWGLSGKLVRIGSVALGIALMPVAAHANGTMVDSFTYTGNQLGSSASGNVYAMSIAGTQLNTCLFTPMQGQAYQPPNLEYTPSCQSTLAPAPINSNSYTAVAFLGVSNNPNNYFAVGDSGGNIYLMQMTFSAGNPNPINVQVPQRYSLASPDNANNSCGQIASLALDPNGSYLYVSCVQTKNSIFWWASNSTSYGALYGVTLAVYAINSNGSLSFINNVSSSVPSGNSGYWAQTVTSNAARSAVTAAAFPSNPNRGVTNVANAVNPKLRVYPPGYPALAGTVYSSSGAVFLSGILSGFSGDVPINSGLLCSGGSCQVAYNMAFSQNYGGWVFTAAEYGTTYSPNNTPGAPVLYWNQVQASVSSSIPDGINIFTNINNALQTCLLNNLITSTVTTAANTCATTNTVKWPPITNIPSSTIWIDQLVFSPTPAATVGNTSFTQGLLQISAWNNGYLAYYDVAANTFESGLFMSNNGSNGQVGANVQGITTDSAGNMLIQAGSSGLLGFNAFPTSSTNIETQSDVTYVPIPADTNPNNICGTTCRVKQAYGFVKFMVNTVVTTP